MYMKQKVSLLFLHDKNDDVANRTPHEAYPGSGYVIYLLQNRNVN